ncbi:MAG: hypothetical protein HZC28_20105 [Spirochaetes bacterium]|nr:hypothetical protein [Spirochaetota bacterium]
MSPYNKIILTSALGIAASLCIIFGFVRFSKHENLRINYQRYERQMPALVRAIDNALSSRVDRARAAALQIAEGKCITPTTGDAWSAVSCYTADGKMICSTSPDASKRAGISGKHWFTEYRKHSTSRGFVAMDAAENSIVVVIPMSNTTTVFDLPMRAMFGDFKKSTYFSSVALTLRGFVFVDKTIPAHEGMNEALTAALADESFAVPSNKPRVISGKNDGLMKDVALIGLSSMHYPAVSVYIAVKRISSLMYVLFAVLVLLFVPLLFFMFIFITYLLKLKNYKESESLLSDEPLPEHMAAVEPSMQLFSAPDDDTQYLKQMQSMNRTIEESREITADIQPDTPPAKTAYVVDGDELQQREDEYFSSDDAFNLNELSHDFLDTAASESTDTDMRPSAVPAEDAADAASGPDENVPSMPLHERLPREALTPPEPEDEPNEVPRVPDAFYDKEPAQQREDLTGLIADVAGVDANADALWKKTVRGFGVKHFTNAAFGDMFDMLKNEHGVVASKCLFLARNDTGAFAVTDAYDVSDDTRAHFTIGERETLYTGMLAKKKALYIKSRPFNYRALAAKVGESDRADVKRILFIPVLDDAQEITGFFVIMNVAAYKE